MWSGPSSSPVPSCTPARRPRSGCRRPGTVRGGGGATKPPGWRGGAPERGGRGLAGARGPCGDPEALGRPLRGCQGPGVGVKVPGAALRPLGAPGGTRGTLEEPWKGVGCSGCSLEGPRGSEGPLWGGPGGAGWPPEPARGPAEALGCSELPGRPLACQLGGLAGLVGALGQWGAPWLPRGCPEHPGVLLGGCLALERHLGRTQQGPGVGVWFSGVSRGGTGGTRHRPSPPAAPWSWPRVPGWALAAGTPRPRRLARC